MALKDQIKPITEFISSKKEYLQHNEDLFTIYEGDLLSFVEKALKEQLNEQSYEQARGRIAPINILKRIVDKLSKIYQQNPSRHVIDGSEADSELLKWYENSFKIDQKMNVCNEFFNLFKTSLIQPYLHNRIPQLRVIPSDRFLPYSDDNVDPTNPTAIIIYDRESVDSAGNRTKVYYIFTDTEFLIFNDKGEILYDEMAEFGNPEGINEIGKIPFIYVNRSNNLLVPYQDTDTKRLTVLISVLLSDLNLGVLFQSYSILYGINVQSHNLSFNPNAFWILENEDPEKKPEIGMIKPQIDIDAVLGLIQSELSFWLNSRGIRPGSIGELTNTNFSSGISKMIDEMDAFEERKKQVDFFTDAENSLWDLIFNYMNPYWVKNNMIDTKHLFTPTADVQINFAPQVPMLQRADLIKELKEELSAGFTSRRRALQQLNPKLSEEEIDDLIAEIDGERTIDVSRSEDFLGEDGDDGGQMAEEKN